MPGSYPSAFFSVGPSGPPPVPPPVGSAGQEGHLCQVESYGNVHVDFDAKGRSTPVSPGGALEWTGQASLRASESLGGERTLRSFPQFAGAPTSIGDPSGSPGGEVSTTLTSEQLSSRASAEHDIGGPG